MEANLRDEGQDVAAREGAGPLTAQRTQALRQADRDGGRGWGGQPGWGAGLGAKEAGGPPGWGGGAGGRRSPGKTGHFQARDLEKILHFCSSFCDKAP